MSDRVHTLRLMLERYPEARAEAQGGGSSGGRREARLLGFDPYTWTQEMRELERCLERLRALAHGRSPMLERGISSRRAWWHLRQRYLEARVVRREIHTRKTHSGERVPKRLPANMELASRQTVLHGQTTYALVRVWHPDVDERVVEAALRYLDAEFRGAPALPAESAA